MKGQAINILVGLFLLVALGAIMGIYQMGADSMANNTTSDTAKVLANLIPVALVVGAAWSVLKLVQFAFSRNPQY